MNPKIEITPTPAGWRIAVNGVWAGNIIERIPDEPEHVGYVAAPGAINVKCLAFPTLPLALHHLLNHVPDSESMEWHPKNEASNATP